MTNAEYPTARRDDLVVQETDDEVLVYDLRSNKASCLNSTAALVWHHCDGTKNAADITGAVSIAAKAIVSEELIQLALAQLSKNRLLTNTYTNVSAAARVSRRELVKKIGLSSAIALPVVASLIAPSAVHAASACVTGGGCLCDAVSMGMVGEICNPATPCADGNCRCAWADAGNAMGTCVP